MFNLRRVHFALRACFYHFLLSVFLTICTAALVFGVWYPWPLYKIVGGLELFWLVVGVDVICGPLLTFIIFNPEKIKRELFFDLSLVALVQGIALAYGIHTVATARPVHLVFEVDRLRVVTAAEIDTAGLVHAPETMSKLPWFGPTLISLRSARNSSELVESVDLSIAGVEPSLRPGWWQDYDLGVPELLRRARPLDVLFEARAAQKELLDKAIKNSGLPVQDLAWLPLTSSKSMEWIVLVDKATGRPRAYAPIDGFLTK
ncbi:TfpX/TfpZ family type IV pilin accessory protein [Acidovorax sp. 106]|uniref:TfpX/TfpZ family type IV pilin accessory protein n=1 Tax=Acidovorax sp. 106 TaxID=2135637 RepID=UPI000F20EDEE|nr:TfpX/TfpZ family type IV pilin accessory protein [Acidovorax sp. 106]RLJ37750.1 hypothetical protein C8C98_1468 [Acidovorax sp. 106]